MLGPTNSSLWREPQTHFSEGTRVERLGVRLITQWSTVHRSPPPLRPLVRHAPRAGVQAPDQRFLIPALVEDASFSGVFLGALSTLRRACHGRVARRVWPLSCGFAAGFSVELLAHSAAQGMRTQCPDQRDPDGTGQRSVFGVLPWRPVGRYGRAFGARWFRSRLGTLQSRAVVPRRSRFSELTARGTQITAF